MHRTFLFILAKLASLFRLFHQHLYFLIFLLPEQFPTGRKTESDKCERKHHLFAAITRLQRQYSRLYHHKYRFLFLYSCFCHLFALLHLHINFLGQSYLLLKTLLFTIHRLQDNTAVIIDTCRILRLGFNHGQLCLIRKFFIILIILFRLLYTIICNSFLQPFAHCIRYFLSNFRITHNNL